MSTMIYMTTDDGAIFQAQVPVTPGDTPETLAAKVQQLEHAHYPRVIEEILNSAQPNLSNHR